MNPSSRFTPAVAALALCLCPLAAQAALYTVGDDPDRCSFPNLQAALNQAHLNPGADTIRIVRNVNWTAQQASIATDGDVEIAGGYLTCTSQLPTGKTTLSGAGGQARSVIALRGNAIFVLRDLVITGGDQAGDDDGGGIHFEGGGIVHVIDSTLTENSADEGGGIYAHGSTSAAEVILEDTLVLANTARRHGGGAVAQEIEMTIRGDESSLLNNVAGGSGGGLLVRSGTRESHAYVSGGLFGISGNRAMRGGGVAVQTGPEYTHAEVNLFAIDSEVPLLIANNIATERGGGIDVQPDYGTGLASGFPGSETTARALLRNVDLQRNTAPVGAAFNLAHVNYGIGFSAAMGGQLNFNVDAFQPLHPSAAPCPVGKPCGYIRGNETGNLTGAVMHVSNDARFRASRIVVEDNTGGWLAYIAGEDYVRFTIDNSLVIDNTAQNALIRDDQNTDGDGASLGLYHVTLAGNTVGANGLLSMNEEIIVSHTLVHQPGKPLFATDVGTTGGGRDLQYVLVSDEGDAPGTIAVPPRFVDPARGDYSLRAGSAAVDRAPPVVGVSQDLYGAFRGVDLPVKRNIDGFVDIGALERPSLPPLVLNADFDADLNLWGVVGATWDATQNVEGATNSGSARVPMPTVIGKGAKVAGGIGQCVHVPGPGVYELNGFARVVPSSGPMASSRASLSWSVHYNGTPSGCGDGPVGQSGLHPLATTSTWTRPATPAYIVIPSNAWTPNTSITVVSDVDGAPSSPPTAWFDGIQLVVGSAPSGFDRFADGFE